MYGKLWDDARDALASIVDFSKKFDIDGVDIYFLNNPNHECEIKVWHTPHIFVDAW
jgi:hypothetical protein